MQNALMCILLFALAAAAGPLHRWQRPRASAASPAVTHGSATQSAGGSCSLSPGQQLAAVTAFGKMMPVFRHPRCVNCHGGVNPFIESTGPDAADPTAPSSTAEHGGGKIIRANERSSDGTLLIETECQDCHSNLAPRRDGSKSVWMTAPNFLSFVDKNATTLCRQVKRTSHSAEEFFGHLKDDNGGNNFTGTAYHGNRGLDPDQFDDIDPAPPSVSHEAFMQLGHKWVAAMGGKLEGDESCGCVKPKLELTMNTTVSGTSQGQVMTGAASATVPLTTDSSSSVYRGEAPLVHGKYTMPSSLPPNCSMKISPEGGTLAVREARFDAADDGRTTIALAVNPTNSGGTVTITCPGYPTPLTMPLLQVAQQWRFVHEPDRRDLDYRFDKFEMSAGTSSGDGRTLVGRKDVTRTIQRQGVTISAKTTFEFWSAPDGSK